MDCSQLTAVSWWMKEEWVRGWVGGEGVVLAQSECVFCLLLTVATVYSMGAQILSYEEAEINLDGGLVAKNKR